MKCFHLFLVINIWQKTWVISFGKKRVLEGCIHIYMYLPFFCEGNRISWSTPPLFHSCLTVHLCSLSSDTPVTVSQLNFVYVLLVSMVSPCWDFRIVLPSFSCQCILITPGKKSSRRQRYVPTLWIFLSAIEGRKTVGLGDMSSSGLSSVGENVITIKILSEKHKHCVLWNHPAQ